MGASNNDLTIIKDADERIREYRTGSIKIHGFYGKYDIQVLNEEKTMGGTFEIKKGHTSPIQINLK